LLELAQNRFPFPNDLSPIELMMYITNAEVRSIFSSFVRLYRILTSVINTQPPRLDDEPGVEWSEDMKDFIKST
jgi:mitogen-activated protein kinase kinase